MCSVHTDQAGKTRLLLSVGIEEKVLSGKSLQESNKVELSDSEYSNRGEDKGEGGQLEGILGWDLSDHRSDTSSCRLNDWGSQKVGGMWAKWTAIFVSMSFKVILIQCFQNSTQGPI